MRESDCVTAGEKKNAGWLPASGNLLRILIIFNRKPKTENRKPKTKN